MNISHDDRETRREMHHRGRKDAVAFHTAMLKALRVWSHFALRGNDRFRWRYSRNVRLVTNTGLSFRDAHETLLASVTATLA